MLSEKWLSKQESRVSVSAPARQKQKGCRDKAGRSTPLQRGLSGAQASSPLGKDGSSPRASLGWLRMSCFAQLGQRRHLGDAKPLLGAAQVPPLLCFCVCLGQRGTSVARGAAALCPPQEGTLSPGRRRLWTPRLPPRLTSALEPCAPADPPLSAPSSHRAQPQPVGNAPCPELREGL